MSCSRMAEEEDRESAPILLSPKRGTQERTLPVIEVKRKQNPSAWDERKLKRLISQWKSNLIPLVGAPDGFVSSLEPYVRDGISHVVFFLPYGEEETGIELLGRLVLPKLSESAR